MPRGVPRIPGPHEWLLKKTCARCGETKPWTEFSPVRYDADGLVANVHSRCRKCQWQARKAQQQEYRARNRDRMRVYNTEWKRRRIAELKAEAKGFGVCLPVEPFRQWLADRFGEGGCPPPGTLYPLAVAAGVHPDTLTKVFSSTAKTAISATTVDAVLIAAGEHPRDLYPDWYEEAA